VANGGTVFLDEIGDMDLAVQPKLLKVVEEGRFRRLGEVNDRSVDVRLIAATHHDLAALAREHRFREDLYYRINTYPLHVPALKDRREDIPLLAPRIAEELGRETGRGAVDIAPDAIEMLMDHDWPGNLRELRNVIERALIVSGQPRIAREDLRFESTRRTMASAAHPDEPSHFAPEPPVAPAHLEMTLGDLERLHIVRVFEAAGGRVEEAARRLDIPRSTLYQKLREYGVALRR
jgi:DNA-binding NtrC family response regulator